MRSPRSPKSQCNATQRAARRCAVCPERPLRSQCIHTKSGVKYLQQLSATAPVIEPTFTSADNTTTQVSMGQVLDSAPLPQPLPAVTGPIAADVLPSHVNLHWLLQLYQSQFNTNPDPAENHLVSTPPPPSTPPCIPPQAPVVQVSPDGSISDLANEHVPEYSNDNDLFSFRQSSPDTSEQDDQSTHKLRVRISSKNAIHDFVAGAMRGNKTIAIPRSAPLRPASESTAQATRRFNRELPQLISRCERLSEETGCWLILAAQHANGTSAATHYTSTRLRRDARKETVNILNSFQTLTSCLLASKREEALHLAQKLAAVEEAKVQALKAKEAELAERDELISQYEARLRSLEA